MPGRSWCSELCVLFSGCLPLMPFSREHSQLAQEMVGDTEDFIQISLSSRRTNLIFASLIIGALSISDVRCVVRLQGAASLRALAQEQ
jgi:hypothetical protein